MFLNYRSFHPQIIPFHTMKQAGLSKNQLPCYVYLFYNIISCFFNISSRNIWTNIKKTEQKCINHIISVPSIEITGLRTAHLLRCS